MNRAIRQVIETTGVKEDAADWADVPEPPAQHTDEEWLAWLAEKGMQ